MDVNGIFLFRRQPAKALYGFIVLLLLTTLTVLPLVSTTVSIRTTGITRPTTERAEVRPVLNGVLDTLLAQEGDTVAAGAIIAIIKDNITAPKASLNAVDQGLRQQFVADLKQLTTSEDLNSLQLSTPLYRQQLNRFLFQQSEIETSLKKARYELKLAQTLFNDQVISQKEFFDKQIEADRQEAGMRAFHNEQLTNWQADLQRHQTELWQLASMRQQIKTDQIAHGVKAPVSGVVQGITNRYKGSYVQAGESLCVITPLGSLIGECYASSRDVGLLAVGQPVRFQIDAFDYNYFGVLTGFVTHVDNDYTLLEGKPVFRVRCGFDSTQLHLRNGFTGELKKGMTFQARFVVAERTLWQLLFDTIDDWLNPAAPPGSTLRQRGAPAVYCRCGLTVAAVLRY